MMPEGFRQYALRRVDTLIERSVWFSAIVVLMMIQIVIADKALSETVREQMATLVLGQSPWELLFYLLFMWTILPLVTVSLRILHAWFKTDGEPFRESYWREYA